MIVTTSSRATARPSIWVPMPNVMPPDCHHVHVVDDGRDDGVVPPRRAA